MIGTVGSFKAVPSLATFAEQSGSNKRHGGNFEFRYNTASIKLKFLGQLWSTDDVSYIVRK